MTLTTDSGIAAQDSISVHNSLRIGVPPKLLAKQWLSVYQQGPRWVLPVVLTSVASNAFLAFVFRSSSSSSSVFGKRSLYALSGALMWMIPMITIFIFEPGVNGACKVKTEELLRDEGVVMKDKKSTIVPRLSKHSASEKSRQWAERVGMEELVESWANENVKRCVVALMAAGVSGFATLVLS